MTTSNNLKIKKNIKKKTKKKNQKNTLLHYRVAYIFVNRTSLKTKKYNSYLRENKKEN